MIRKVLVVVLIAAVVVVMVVPSMIAKPVYAPRPLPPDWLTVTEAGSLETFRPELTGGLHGEFPSEPQHP